MIRTRILRMGLAQESFDLIVGLTIDGLNWMDYGGRWGRRNCRMWDSDGGCQLLGVLFFCLGASSLLHHMALPPGPRSPMLSDKNDPTWCTLNRWAVHMHTCCTYSTDMCIPYDSLKEKQENHTMTQGNIANNSWETLAQKGSPPQTTKDWLWCWVFPKTPQGVCYTVEVSVRIPLWLGNHTPVGHSGSSQWFGMIQMSQEFKSLGSACG